MKKVIGMLIFALLSAGFLTFSGCKKSAELPAVTTSGISQVTPTTAETGGEVISAGTNGVTHYGVCWSTSPGPTVTGSKTIDGSGSGAFTSKLTGLDPATTYYVRAYAANYDEAFYGEEISFTTGNFNYGTVSDIEGNSYKTIQIGNQIWMAENLRVTKYNDGSSIPNVTDHTEWSAMETDAYCWYENNADEYKDDYGALYNSYAVRTNKLCPDGWHVPSEDDFSQLASSLGGMEYTASKLKEYGFSPLAAGARYIEPDYDWQEYKAWMESEWAGKGFAALWWASSLHSYYSLSMWGVSYDSEYSDFSNYLDEKAGLPVRCIKD